MGIGLPPHACKVMEWGFDGVLLNSCIARSRSGSDRECFCHSYQGRPRTLFSQANERAGNRCCEHARNRSSFHDRFPPLYVPRTLGLQGSQHCAFNYVLPFLEYPALTIRDETAQILSALLIPPQVAGTIWEHCELSVFSCLADARWEVILEVSQEVKGKSLILNGGQRRDRTADAGLFRAPYQWT